MTKLLLAGLALALTLTGAQARDITHAMGVTDVPDNPQRVVVLTNEGTEALVWLGTIPVGAVKSWDADPFYEHIATPLAETVPLGTENAVNMEIVASLEPDLIIGSKVRQEKIYDQLSAIAPTIMSENLADWQANVLLYSQAVGKAENGKAAIEKFATRTTALNKALGDAVNEEISVVRFAPGRIRLYYRDTFPGSILNQIGFKRPASQDKQAFAEEITKERIPEMDGDRIFYFSDDKDPPESVATLEEWQTDGLWQNLSAVKAGKAQRVSELVWNVGGGIFCAHMMLDAIADIYDVSIPAV